MGRDCPEPKRSVVPKSAITVTRKDTLVEIVLSLKRVEEEIEVQ